MRIEKITNKVLIGVEKQLETLGVKYKELHKNEIPVFDPNLFGLSKTFYPLRTLKMINVQYTVLISRHGNID